MIDIDRLKDNISPYGGRAVYIYDDESVIKYTRYNDNRKEVELYERLKETNSHLLRYLFAILEYTEDYHYVRMERAVEILYDRFKGLPYSAEYEWFNTDPIGKEIRNIGDALNIHDRHAGNIGFRADGSWGFVDYTH